MRYDEDNLARATLPASELGDNRQLVIERRLRVNEAELRYLMMEVGSEVLADDMGSLKYHTYGAEGYAADIARGKSFGIHDDVPQQDLRCLMSPRPGAQK